MMDGNALRLEPESQDAAFLRELLFKVESGQVSHILCIGDGPDGKSFIAGPGLDRQLMALSLMLNLNPDAMVQMNKGPISSARRPQ